MGILKNDKSRLSGKKEAKMKGIVIAAVLLALISSASANAQKNETAVLTNDTAQSNLTITSTTLQNFPSSPATLSIKTNADAECLYSGKPKFSDPSSFEKKIKNLDGSFSHSSNLNIDEGLHHYDISCSMGNISVKSSADFRVGMPSEEKPGSPVRQPEDLNNNAGLGIFGGALILAVLIGNLVFLVIKTYKFFQPQNSESGKKLEMGGYASQNNAPSLKPPDYQNLPAGKPAAFPDASSRQYSYKPRQALPKSRHFKLKRKEKESMRHEIKEEFVTFEDYLDTLRMKTKSNTMEILRKIAGKK